MDILERDGSKELAGFERCRTDLWGHAVVKELGAKLLPTLAREDIYAEGDAVTQLEHDIKLILAHIPAIATATGYEATFITERAQNILDATRHAQEIDGCVVIW
jgi:hypothetical protein